MPFKLPNAKASFQGYISKILAKKLYNFIIVYLDNILIYIKKNATVISILFNRSLKN